MIDHNEMRAAAQAAVNAKFSWGQVKNWELLQKLQKHRSCLNRAGLEKLAELRGLEYIDQMCSVWSDALRQDYDRQCRELRAATIEDLHSRGFAIGQQVQVLGWNMLGTTFWSTPGKLKVNKQGIPYVLGPQGQHWAADSIRHVADDEPTLFKDSSK